MTAERLIIYYDLLSESEKDKFMFMQEDREDGKTFYIIKAVLSVIGFWVVLAGTIYGLYKLVNYFL